MGCTHKWRLFALCNMLFFSLFTTSYTSRAQDSIVSVDLADGVRIEMVWVEGGTFVMGSNRAEDVKYSYDANGPEHQVTVGGFFIGRYEVTQGQWTAVMGENPSFASHGGDDLPVEMVSWEDAKRFTTLLSQLTGRRFRLPSEAEWEYAARGGRRSQKTPYAGAVRNTLPESCWFCVNSENHVHPVGQLKPNELGLYDMGGNVAEWCLDWMELYSAEAQENPRGPRVGDSRIVRGGHYGSTSPACTVYDRGWYVPSGKCEFYGLRLALEPDVEEEDDL